MTYKLGIMITTNKGVHMSGEEIIESVGREVRVQLHRLDGHIDACNVPNDFTADVRRLADQAIERAYAMGQADAARDGTTRTALLTIEGEWRDVAKHARLYGERITAEQIAEAFHAAAQRYTIASDEPRYQFDEHSVAG